MKQKQIPPGTVILEEKPFVYILNSRLRLERCGNCLEKKKVLKCSGCQHVHYCGRVCQKESWAIHKVECANIKRVAPKIVPDAARLLSRLVIKLQSGGHQQKGYYTGTSFRRFKDLMSHYSDIKKDAQRMEHFMSLCGVLAEYLQDVQIPNSVELLGIYGRMCVNGFNILDSEMTTIGTGIYLGASVIDHSCKPNALAVFQGTTIYIRTLELLPTLDWHQIFITYIDLLDTPKERQANLQCNYYFLCQCSLCLDISQLQYMHSAVCPNSECEAMLDMNCLDTEETVKCDECQRGLSDQALANYRTVVDFTNCQLLDMKNMAYLDLCKMCLQKQKGVFHPLNLLHVKTLDLAFEACIQIGNWDYAADIGICLLPGYRQYYGELHPLRGILLLKMGKIMLFKNKANEALKFLTEAQTILSVTHGAQHALYRESVLPLMYQATKEAALAPESMLIELVQ